ncbi:MAG: Zn-dependent hydrolase [Jatrophihabitans sp.]
MAGAELLASVEALARVGADPRGGLSRLGLTASERAARELVSGLARRYGLQAGTDAAANLILRRREPVTGRPILLIGSHLDTVEQGGSLDGAYGVLAGVQVLRVLDQLTLRLPYEPVVIGFANEEGGYLNCPFWGSKAFTGQLADPGELIARDGTPIDSVLRAAGGDLSRLGQARVAPGSVGGYLELHIEQGPVLHEAGIPIGVVSAITGRTVLSVVVEGSQNHAGTTPMEHRRDALAAAARVVLAVEAMARDERRCAVATVGTLDVDPQSTNVVAGRVRLGVELRDSAPRRLAEAERSLAGRLDQIAASCRVQISQAPVMRCAPALGDPRLIEQISSAADRLGLESMLLASGAGHDAQVMAAETPIGMIFVPSIGGISHAPGESTAAADLVRGADVLLQAALAICDQPAPPTDVTGAAPAPTS